MMFVSSPCAPKKRPICPCFGFSKILKVQTFTLLKKEKRKTYPTIQSTLTLSGIEYGTFDQLIEDKGEYVQYQRFRFLGDWDR